MSDEETVHQYNSKMTLQPRRKSKNNLLGVPALEIINDKKYCTEGLEKKAIFVVVPKTKSSTISKFAEPITRNTING